MKQRTTWTIRHWLLIGAAAALAACAPPPATDADAVDVDPYATSGEDAAEFEDMQAPSDTGAREETLDPTPDDSMGDVEIARYAEAVIGPANGSLVAGNVLLKEEGGVVYMIGEITGLSPGEHGFHIHENGDCSAPDASSAGGHFAPDDDPHGEPREPGSRHHAGDLGNIVANDLGIAAIDMEDAELSLGIGQYTVVGRAFVVHSEADDLASQPSGDAGQRVGCGVINITPDPAYTF